MSGRIEGGVVAKEIIVRSTQFTISQLLGLPPKQ